MERRILPVATLIALWIGAAYFTYASWKGGVFEVPGSGRSFTQLVAYHVKGIFILYGPYMLASVAIVIGRNSLFVVVVTWFMAACTAFFITLDLSYSGHGIYLFINLLVSWFVGVLALIAGINLYPSRSQSANTTINADARKDSAR